MRILSVDIGTKNCAFYIEEFDEKEFSGVKGSLERLYKIGKRIYWKVINFEKDLKAGIEIFVPILQFLDDNRGIWDKCNGIILEKQMKINYSAQVVQHFIFSYFKTLYGPFKYISDISATRKTQALGAPKKMIKKERKKWAVNEAHRVFDLRDDLEGLKILHSGKADDLADSCLQLKAFQKLVFVDGKLP
jgi:hypothetical protein